MSLGRILTDRQLLKLLCLLLATMLWLFVALEREDTLSLNVPVNYVNIPAGLTLDRPVRMVGLRLSGATILLMRQRYQPPALTLDLHGLGAGSVAFTGLDHALELVPGVRVIRIQPATIELKIRTN